MPRAVTDADREVGARIQSLRKATGLSQTALGAAIGVTFQQVQKYEKGLNRVGAGRLQAIADLLEVPVSTLYGGDGHAGSDVVALLNTPQAAELQTAIDAYAPPTADGHVALTFLQTEYGKPFTANGFGNRFKAWCVEAGLPHCTAHGLRKAGATIAAEHGATEYQLMAIFGWRDPKQAAVYTKMARQRLLAQSAMHLIRLERSSEQKVPPSKGVSPGGTKSTSK